jgi:ubiquinone/menaquinone biosynthesis C-methylase UbiE
MSDASQDFTYVHGTAPEEQRRLSLLNDLLNQAALRELGLCGGERVLDLGSGLGQFSRAVARAAGPAGHVVGVERSAEQLAEAVRQARAAGEESLVEWRQGDALAPPLRDDEWGTFDVAHGRFLLEHVRDPAAVVRTMVRAVRPGGRVVLADDDHDVLRLWPEPPGWGPLWQAYVRSYDRLGNDPYVGRRLVALLHEAGARPVRNTGVFFGGCSGSPMWDLLATNLVNVIVGARETVLTQRLLDAAAFDDAIEVLRAWTRRPDAATWYLMSWAEGVRPAGGP